MTLQTYIVATFILLILFQVKHLLCDYFWQGEYMLGKFHPTEWFYPLAAHALVHATATMVISYMFTNMLYAFCLACTDFMVHFGVDRLKVVLSRQYDSSKDKEFWWLLGVDQFLHHITHYYIILAILAMMYKGA